MSDYDPKDYQHSPQDQQHQHNEKQNDNTMDTLLEARIARVLQEQASHIRFTPASRARVIAHLTSSSRQQRGLAPIFAFTTFAILLLVLGAIFIQSIYHQPGMTPIYYTVNTSINTPSPLAHGGQLISLDPTGQHIVYQVTTGKGVMYTADIKDPSTSNVLAMRDAEAASWSPDGSELVAVIKSGGIPEPFLALIKTGSYMTPLGHSALAASWSPTAQNQIIYATQTNGTTQLFATTPQQQQPARLVATLNITTPIHSLIWSPDGHTLAVLSGSTKEDSASHALYLLDMQTYVEKELVAPGSFTLGSVAWSPNSRYLSYERIETQGKVSIETRDASTGHMAFSISLNGDLNGWSWSAHSDAIIYSDNGTLSARVLHGTPIKFARSAAKQVSPLWLPDGRILCLNIANGTGTLAILAVQQTK